VTDLCALADVPDGSGRTFSFGEGKAAFGIIVLRDGENVTAYVNLCPHFWIPLNVREHPTTFRAHVLCANHYAAFRFADGYCVEGPCEGSSLEPVPLAVHDGRVTVEVDAARSSATRSRPRT
jgi:nitrite reductase/ring-hydroxylating ferredoxin subunit